MYLCETGCRAWFDWTVICLSSFSMVNIHQLSVVSHDCILWCMSCNEMLFVFDANQGTLLNAVALTDIINPAKKANSPESLAHVSLRSLFAVSGLRWWAVWTLESVIKGKICISNAWTSSLNPYCLTPHLLPLLSQQQVVSECRVLCSYAFNLLCAELNCILRVDFSLENDKGKGRSRGKRESCSHFEELCGFTIRPLPQRTKGLYVRLQQGSDGIWGAAGPFHLPLRHRQAHQLSA